MSRLDDLIQEYCPDGVEYKSAGVIFDTCTDYTAAGSFADIAKNVTYRSTPDAALLVRTMDIKNGFTSKNMVYIDNHAYDYLWRVHLDRPCIVMPNIGNCGEVYYLTPENIPYEKAALAPNAILLNSSVADLKYLYYVLQSKDFQKKLSKIVTPVGQTKFNKTDFKTLKVPLPALPVQREIVRILDEFTLLSAELSAELVARKRQYEYYRDELLLFRNDVELKKIKDICLNIVSGGTPNSKNREYYDGNIPWLRTQEVNFTEITETSVHITEAGLANSSAKWIPEHCVIIAMYGATVGKVGYTSIPLTTNQACCNLEIDSTIANYKFVFYYLASKYEFIKSLGQGSQTNINAQTVKELEIPIPTLEVQLEIVRILDYFSSICTDIFSGLPAEIEARQKQYEYYRDKLLTFKDWQH